MYSAHSLPSNSSTAAYLQSFVLLLMKQFWAILAFVIQTNPDDFRITAEAIVVLYTNEAQKPVLADLTPSQPGGVGGGTLCSPTPSPSPEYLKNSLELQTWNFLTIWGERGEITTKTTFLLTPPLFLLSWRQRFELCLSLWNLSFGLFLFLTRSLPRDVYKRRKNHHPGGQGLIYTSHLNFVSKH